MHSTPKNNFVAPALDFDVGNVADQFPTLFDNLPAALNVMILANPDAFEGDLEVVAEAIMASLKGILSGSNIPTRGLIAETLKLLESSPTELLDEIAQRHVYDSLSHEEVMGLLSLKLSELSPENAPIVPATLDTEILEARMEGEREDLAEDFTRNATCVAIVNETSNLLSLLPSQHAHRVELVSLAAYFQSLSGAYRG